MDRESGENESQLFEIYIHHAYNACPYCNSKNIIPYAEIEYFGDYAYRRMQCADCDAYWDEEYELKTIYEVVGPDPDLLKEAEDEKGRQTDWKKE